MAYEFQDRILKKIAGRRTVSLILPMGAGKTRIACMWAKLKPYGPRLVVCPSEAVPVWAEQIKGWLDEPVVIMAKLSRAMRISTLKQMMTADARTIWYIINYESFRSVANHMLGGDPPLLAILDESHAIQSPKAKVTQAVHTWLTPARFKAILSGTPIGNSELNIWAQIYFLDRGMALGRSYYQFRYNYFQPDSMGWKWEITSRGKRLINSTLQMYGVVMSEKELDLPPQTYSQIYLEQTPWQKKHLKTLKEEFAAYFKEENVTYDTKWIVAKIAKVRQVCSGFFYLNTDRSIDGDSGKLKMLTKLLQVDLKGHKTIIWCNFRHEVYQVRNLLRELAIGHVIYHGHLTLEERIECVASFQEEKSVQCFVSTVATGGQAITLTAADRAVYYSNTYSLRDRLQSEKRCHRIGSEIHKRIHYIDLITEGTIEEDIHKLLETKQFQSDAIILRHLLERAVSE